MPLCFKAVFVKVKNSHDHRFKQIFCKSSISENVLSFIVRPLWVYQKKLKEIKKKKLKERLVSTYSNIKETLF